MQEQFIPPPPKKVNNSTPINRFKKTYNKSLQMFIERIEQELFDTEIVNNVRQHLARDERNALAEI